MKVTIKELDRLYRDHYKITSYAERRRDGRKQPEIKAGILMMVLIIVCGKRHLLGSEAVLSRHPFQQQRRQAEHNRHAHDVLKRRLERTGRERGIEPQALGDHGNDRSHDPREVNGDEH